MPGIQAALGGVCGAKKGGLALHFGVESASNKYSKLLVVRVDLHVLEDVWLNDSKLIDKLLKNIRKTKYKDHLFGYFWVPDYP